MKTIINKAFTLVELIVVITILSILGTIAFISLQGYSVSARDSIRISDVSNMETSLELFSIDSSRYPGPTNSIDITYSGSVAWIQGEFGDSVIQNLRSINEPITDPLTNNNYTYSVTYDKKEYQIGGILEGSDISGYVMNKTFANNGQIKAFVSGNYNGKTINLKNNNDLIILTVPSILASDITNVDLIEIIRANRLIYDGFSNLPESYTNSKFDVNQGSTETIVNDNILVYSGLFEGAGGIVEDQDIRIQVLKNIQYAYSGSVISNEEGVKSLLESPVNLTTPSITNLNTISYVINDTLKTKIELLDPSPLNWTSVPKNYRTYFAADSIYTKEWSSNNCGEMNLLEINPGTDTIVGALSPNTIYKLKTGVYNITSTIYLNDCTGIIGEGDVIIKNNSAIDVISGTSVNNIIVNNIDIEGTSGIRFLDGITLSSVNDSTINNVKSTYGTYSILLNNSDNSRLNNIITSENTYNGIALVNGSDNSIMSKLKVFNNSGDGIVISYSNNTQISNTQTFRNHWGYFLDHANYTTITNLISFNNNDCGTRNQYSDYVTLNNMLSFSQGCYGFNINNSDYLLLNNAITYSSHSGPYSYSSTQAIFNNIISYSGLRNDNGFYYGQVDATTKDDMILGSLSEPIIQGLGFKEGIFSDNNNVVDLDYITTRILDGGVYNENVSFVYGSKTYKQTKPVRYDIDLGKYVLYGTEGVEYNTSKRITEW